MTKKHFAKLADALKREQRQIERARRAEIRLEKHTDEMSTRPVPATVYNSRLNSAAPAMLAALREIVDLNPIENNADEGDRCFFCGKDLDYGPGLSLVEAHEEDCPFMMARKAIAKATGNA